jgi:TM2 domain-containing membrane protein YozV
LSAGKRIMPVTDRRGYNAHKARYADRHGLSYSHQILEDQPVPNPADTHSKLIGYILWIFGFMGAHRLYLGKWLTALLWLLTGGLFLLGYLYDYWTLNDQIDEVNRVRAGGSDLTPA